MAPRSALLLVAAAAVAAATLVSPASAASALLPSQCAAAGFTVGEVACSTCEAMAKAALPATLVADCKSCCTPALDFLDGRQYDAAVLHVCHTRLSSYGGVNEFIEKGGPERYPALRVVDLPGSLPTLKFGGEEDEALKTMQSSALSVVISNWKTEQIAALLDRKLRRG
jgi:hypothetical protein